MWMGKDAKRVGIRDVAAVAGVSVTTVSDALNGKGRLSEETRRIVRETAERLGYRPNVTARRLVTGMSGLVAVAIAQSPTSTFAVEDYDYFMQLLNAASVRAFEEGYGVVLAPPASHSEGIWSSIAVDGALLIDPIRNDPAIPTLRRSGLPIVTTGRDPSGSDEDYWVDNDHRSAVRAVFEHMYEEGARHIAVVSGPQFTSYLIDVRREYEEWTERKGLPQTYIDTGEGWTEGAGYDATLRLLESPDPPDAIYTTIDRLALGALLAAREKGVGVPHELMVAACTDSHVARTATPALTTVSLHPSDLGSQAIDMLVRLIHNDEPADRHRLIPWSLEVRASTSRRSESTSEAVETVKSPDVV
jgi:DNA-binding LacI/PurR family transcriptional regulator